MTSRLPNHRASFVQRNMRCAIALVMVAVGAVVLALPGSVQARTPLPRQFDGVDIKNLLGQSFDANIPLTDHNGAPVTLSSLIDGERPVVLTLNFFRCKSLCSVQLNELLTGLEKTGWVPGKDFRVVTVSFDPSDSVEIAHDKRLAYLRKFAEFNAEEADEELTPAQIEANAEAIDWSFLVGSERAVKELTERLGYSYRYDEDTGQYAHSPVTYILSPKGVISRYLYGITYNPRDLKFALMEASDGRVGNLGEKVLLSCFAFDDDHGGYSAFAWGFLRLGGLLTLFIFGSFLFAWWRRERRRSADAADHLTTSTHGAVGSESAR